MTPAVHLRISLALVAGLVFATACASAGRPAARTPATPEECARFAQGYDANGVSMVEKFDSLFDAAQRRTRPPPGDPENELDRPPAVLNARSVVNLMAREYPPDLLFARRGGMTMIGMLVRADGTVDPVRVFRTSGIASLDAASVKVGEEFRFSPGVYRGCPVFVFTVMPITWEPGPAPQGAR